MIRDVHAASRRNRKKAMRSRAWLNGEEVTKRCFYADDRRGIVRVYLKDVNGNYIMNWTTHELEKRQLHGKVVITGLHQRQRHRRRHHEQN